MECDRTVEYCSYFELEETSLSLCVCVGLIAWLSFQSHAIFLEGHAMQIADFLPRSNKSEEVFQAQWKAYLKWLCCNVHT